MISHFVQDNTLATTWYIFWYIFFILFLFFTSFFIDFIICLFALFIKYSECNLSNKSERTIYVIQIKHKIETAIKFGEKKLPKNNLIELH